MRSRPIREGVHWVGAVDWGRRVFDELIPTPDGTSYNAYLVQGSEKTALVDTVEPTFGDTLFARLRGAGVERLDYVVANHAEQDHSGSIPAVLARFPGARLVTSPKGRDMLLDHLDIDGERVDAVDDGATLSLGDRTLEFLHAPWVHWPETMLTYLQEDRILFPCDLFGSHLATSHLVAAEAPGVMESAKRYYAEIMMPFRKMIAKYLKRLDGYDLSLIAPSHGPIFDPPEPIIDGYRDWVLSEPRNQVVLPYVSMHGSTSQMVSHLLEALAARDVPVEPFNLTVVDEGKLAMALVDAATIVLASPTVLAGAHPKAVYAAYLANALRPKLKHAAVIGSYGWGGRTVDQLQSLLAKLPLEWLDPVLVKGLPRATDHAALDRLADEIAARHEGLKRPGDAA
ncbi:FprA family A-type flavoprotein [Myxococcota bacterium]